MTLISDPMDQMLLSPANTTVVEQATAGNDTFPAPYGSQADEEALFAGLSGPSGQRRRKRPVKGMKGVARVVKPVTGGFLPGMGDDDDLGSFKSLFSRWRAQPAPPPPPKPMSFLDRLTSQGQRRLSVLATREGRIDAALARRTARGTALQSEEDRLRALQASGFKHPGLDARLQRIDTWQAQDAARRQQLEARKANIDKKQSMWGGLFSPVTPTPTVAPPATLPAAPVSPAEALIAAPTTTPTTASSSAETVVPVTAPLPAPYVSLAPGAAPGSQFYGLDGLDGMNARRMRPPRARAIKRSGGARRIGTAGSLPGGFLPGLGEELADGDDLAGLGAAPARFKPKMRKGATTATKRMVRRPVTSGFLPGMGDDLGLLPTVPTGMMVAIGIAAAYLLLRK